MPSPRRLETLNPVKLLVDAAMALRGLNVGQACALADMEAARFYALRSDDQLATPQQTGAAAALFGLSEHDTWHLYFDLLAASFGRLRAGDTLAEFPKIYFQLEAAIRAQIGDAKLRANLAKAARAGKNRFRPPDPAKADDDTLRPSLWVAEKLSAASEGFRTDPSLVELIDRVRAEEIAVAERLEARIESYCQEFAKSRRTPFARTGQKISR